ncbi:hypothetical protein PI124_g3958 [Phytophthora idaei]|nr:hypothetical protein PI125_g11550 [Phytophthora idaei]KAG3154244.1 hypothetical protein PI126_g9710 [Phytophthora idaei]KAG3251425.1 hypothetical protein PI124_g3958 [Phytophthora idaei]
MNEDLPSARAQQAQRPSRTILPPLPPPRPTFRRFTAVPREDPTAREKRLLHELRRFGDLNRAITAIPYEYVGNDIRSLYPKTMADSLKRNYPDWYMLTPAYKLSFAGMSFADHVSSFCSRRSGNNLVQRAVRWVKEEKVVIYCDWLDKLSAFASLCVLMMTFTMTCSQIVIGAQMMYQSTGPNSSDGGPVPKESFTQRVEIWYYIKLLLSGIPTVVMTFNAQANNVTEAPRDNNEF